MLISSQDRTWIEGKYHPLDGSYQPLRRFAYHGHRYGEDTGMDDAEIVSGLEKIAKERDGLSHALIKAEGFAYVLDHMRIEVSEHDWFVCLYNWGRLLHAPMIAKWYDDIMNLHPESLRESQLLGRSGASSMGMDIDHFVPSWDDLLNLGFAGLRDRAAKYRALHEGDQPKTDFIDGVIMELDAVIRLLLRLSDRAKQHSHPKAKVLAGVLENIAHNPPATLLEALEVMYVFFMCTESVDEFQTRSMGHGLDATLLRFYEADLSSGRYTLDELKQFLAHYMMQFSAIDNYWGHPFYLCGADGKGNCLPNELTYVLLDVYEELGLYSPKIQVKINPDTPQKLLDRVLGMIRAGQSSFVLCCQPGIIKALMGGIGATYEEARDCDISGCNETHIRGNEACMGNACINIAKAVELALRGGMDPHTGEQVGPKTPLAFDSFADFYEAYLRQFDHLLERTMAICNERDFLVDQANPSLMMTATLDNAMRAGLDGYGHGVKYRTASVALVGLASASDSLLAVKELVFDTKQVTLAELIDALDHNWQGYELLRQKAMKLPHKFGNGDPEADRYATALFQRYARIISGHKTGRGGSYKAAIPSSRHFIDMGRATGALPDGRLAGTELSKNSLPVTGMERRGVTGLMKSAMALTPALFSEAYVLDVMLHPSAVAGQDGLTAMRTLVETYMQQDGVCIQFNIFDASTLRDAQKHPEKYPQLQVRVSGWNVLWNNMAPEEQEAYILRAESLG